jgi:hypothetical protein
MNRTITLVNAQNETLFVLEVATPESTQHFREGLAVSDVAFIEVTDITPTGEVWHLTWVEPQAR